MCEANPRVVAHLEAMRPEEVRALPVRLTSYADWVIKQRTKWMRRPFLPKGYDAGALASEALARVLDTGGRQWNPDADSDFLGYLKSVVRSILWDLQKAAEKEELVDIEEEEMGNVASRDASVEEHLAADDLKDALLDELESDDEKLVLLAIFEGQEKAAEIAESLGLDVERVYKLKWQIRRRLQRFDRSVGS